MTPELALWRLLLSASLLACGLRRLCFRRISLNQHETSNLQWHSLRIELSLSELLCLCVFAPSRETFCSLAPFWKEERNFSRRRKVRKVSLSRPNTQPYSYLRSSFF